MPVSLSQAEADAMTALRAFLLSILPATIEVVQGQTNRVAEPVGPDFVVLTPTLRGRLSTNVSTYQDVPAAGTRRVLASTQLTIQVDAHGPNGAETIQVITTLLRDFAACAAFKKAGVDAAPLYAGDPHQTPFMNGEGQVETRWTADAVLQVNPASVVPQDFAAAMRIDARAADRGNVLTVGPVVMPPSITPPPPVIPVLQSDSYATTIYGNGRDSSFTVKHGLGTQDVVVQVRDPNDAYAVVPGVDSTAPTADTVLIDLTAPLSEGASLRIIVKR